MPDWEELLQKVDPKGFEDAEEKPKQKTPDEIKNGLYSCTYAEGCAVCPYDGIEDCAAKKNVDALSLIEQLEAEKAELVQKMQRLERERAVLLRIADEYAELCEECKHAMMEDCQACYEADFFCHLCKADCICHECEKGSCFEWRGPCEENGGDPDS